MIRVFIGIFAIVYLCFYSYSSAAPIASDPASQIYLIKSFQYNPVVDTYEEVSLGSAVYVAGSQVITNAHVVLDATNRPYGAYVVCTAKTIKNIPKCIYTAKLKKYDSTEDLALLEIHNISSQTPVILGQESMLWQSSDASIGEAIRAYGYPSNGGDTMTMTEGKLSGYLDGNYKIDANLDGGNSGGGAFNSKNEFIGIPYAVRSGYTTLGYVIPTRKVQKFINSPKEGVQYNQWDTLFLQTIKRDIKAQGTTKISTRYINWSKFLGFRVAAFNSTLSGDRFLYTLQSSNKKTFLTVQKNKIISTSGIFSSADLSDMLDALGYDTSTDSHLKTNISKDVNIGKIYFPIVHSSTYTKNNEDSFYNKYYINGVLSIAIFGDSLKQSQGDIRAFLSAVGSYFMVGTSDIERTSSVNLGYFRYNIGSTGYGIIAPPMYAHSNSLLATVRDGSSTFTMSSWYYPDFDSVDDKSYSFDKYIIEGLTSGEFVESGTTATQLPYVIIKDTEDDELYLYTIIYKGTTAQILSIAVSERDKPHTRAILRSTVERLSGISGTQIR